MFLCVFIYRSENQRRILSKLKEEGFPACAVMVFESSVDQGSYRSGGVALIDGVFEVGVQLIKCNNLKTEKTEKKIKRHIFMQSSDCIKQLTC